VSDEIISRYKGFSEDGTKPIFTFAVTMQNHGSYNKNRYKEEEKEIYLRTPISEEFDSIIEVYSEGLRYGSEAFIYLTEYFKDIERPTYIIMFGDHAPYFAGEAQLYALNENFELYMDDYYNMQKMPVIVWSNKEEINNRIYSELSEIKNLSAFMLTEEIFNMTELPKPSYIEMLSNIKNITNGWTSKFTLDNNGNYMALSPEFIDNAKIKEIYEKLKVVQYDTTLGKNYVIKEFE